MPKRVCQAGERFWPIVVAALLPWATAFGAEPAATDLLQQPGVAAVEFVFEKAPFAECHASTIVETGDGLVAAWFGGTEEQHPDVGIWLSRHERGKWTAPIEVANGVESPARRYPTWNPVLFRPKPGPLMLFYKMGPSPSRWWGMVMTSEDGGKSWSKPRRLPDGILGPIKNKPVQLANGDILSPSSTESAADGWRVHFERSSDGGQTWAATPPVNDGREIQAIQPSILVHKDGRLHAIGRTRNNRLFEVWSRDVGRTWGPMLLTSLPNPSAGIDAVTLADGRHLLVYNHTRRGGEFPHSRGLLNVAVSDDGVRWSAALLLEQGEAEFSYPAVILTSDGLVHITYTWKRERIKHVVVEPAKLQLTPIVDGKWPNRPVRKKGVRTAL